MRSGKPGIRCLDSGLIRAILKNTVGFGIKRMGSDETIVLGHFSFNGDAWRFSHGNHLH